MAGSLAAGCLAAWLPGYLAAGSLAVLLLAACLAAWLPGWPECCRVERLPAPVRLKHNGRMFPGRGNNCLTGQQRSSHQPAARALCYGGCLLSAVCCLLSAVCLFRYFWVFSIFVLCGTRYRDKTHFMEV